LGAAAASREQYRIWVVEALRALGGEASPADVQRWIRDNRAVPSEDLSGLTADGDSLFRKEVRWARLDLFHSGVIGSPRRGVWKLIG
jgi:hypothetical protein